MLSGRRLGSADASLDSSLFAAARRGSDEARSEIVRRHWDDAYRVTYLLTHDRGVAEDLAQEAMVAALGAFESFDERRPFRPWLQRIAANKAHDWLRRRDRRPEIVHTELVDMQEAERIADEVAEHALDEELVAALGRLEPLYRTAVVLRYLLELEPQEIAQIIEVPAPTVRTRVHRGLRLLHADLTATSGGLNEQAR
jgi:RNA polymerase sigma-70 factor (ECF subfamily)